jgi:hypothetical protein
VDTLGHCILRPKVCGRSQMKSPKESNTQRKSGRTSSSGLTCSFPEDQTLLRACDN